MSFHIDERVQRLCGELNLLKTVQTFSSCGGHPNPAENQQPEGTFNVNFYADWTEEGEDDLDRIAFAASKFLGKELEPGEFEQYVGDCRLTAWWNGEFEELKGVLCFELSGDCDPQVLAVELAKARLLERL